MINFYIKIFVFFSFFFFPHFAYCQFVIENSVSFTLQPSFSSFKYGEVDVGHRALDIFKEIYLAYSQPDFQLLNYLDNTLKSKDVFFPSNSSCSIVSIHPFPNYFDLLAEVLSILDDITTQKMEANFVNWRQT